MSFNLCAHQTGPITAQTEPLLRRVCWGMTGKWLVFLLFWKKNCDKFQSSENEPKTIKQAKCISPVGKKESKPTTGKLKPSNRSITHYWDVPEVMAFLRLEPQILTFLHSPARTNETLWWPSCLSLGWHWQEQLYLHQSRVFCPAAFPHTRLPPPWSQYSQPVRTSFLHINAPPVPSVVWIW